MIPAAKPTFVQDLWTREQFAEWLLIAHDVPSHAPFLIAPCCCGYLSCHGWRLVVSAVVES